jgi:ACR3 family arsenite efflux pump ArsB
MACLFLLVILAFPRLILAVLFLFSTYLSRAYHHNLLILILGFVFAPLTTMLYAWMFNNRMPAEGVNLVLLLVAVLVDFGLVGGGFRRQRSRA